MSLQNLAIVNTLQVLPFYDLDDKEFGTGKLVSYLS